jgi:hypothetical protein
MYGHKKYQRVDKPVNKSSEVAPSSAPTYVCAKCRGVKTTNYPHIELTALENGQLFMYTRLCSPCSMLLRTWING